MSQHTAHLMRQLGTTFTPARAIYPGAPERKPMLKSYSLGADLVAILLVVAALTDGDRYGEGQLYGRYDCEEISRYAGQSHSTTSGKLTRLAELGWLTMTKVGRHRYFQL